MKVIVCKDEDGMMLLLKMQQKLIEQRQRAGSADKQMFVEELHRGVNYVLVEWLQEQGFKSP